jgi:hypothetical protein
MADGGGRCNVPGWNSYVNDEHRLLISFWKTSEINSTMTSFGYQNEGIFPVRTDGLP